MPTGRFSYDDVATVFTTGPSSKIGMSAVSFGAIAARTAASVEFGLFPDPTPAATRELFRRHFPVKMMGRRVEGHCTEMANDPGYVIDAAAVVSDVIAGEAVMLHRGSGDYFSTDGVGGVIWEWIGEGQSRGSILDGLNQRFAADPAEIETAVDAFLADLVKHKLIQEIDGDIETSTKASIEPQTKASIEPQLISAFAPPVLHVYSDIRRMILLDPIHEAAEAGWPNPA